MIIRIALALLFVLLILVNVILGSALNQHRTDVPRNAPLWSGPSRIWQVNMLVHARFDPRGKVIKRWIIGIIAAQCVLALVLMATLTN